MSKKWEKHYNDHKGIYEVYSVKSGSPRICAILNQTEEESIADLIAAAPETKKQRDDLLKACKELLTFQDTDSMFRLPANLPEIDNMRQAIKQAEKD